jgi:hypothetical protein
MKKKENKEKMMHTEQKRKTHTHYTTSIIYKKQTQKITTNKVIHTEKKKQH